MTTSLSSALSASSTPATAPASKTFPSSTNSSTLSESASSARDKPRKSDWRPDVVPPPLSLLFRISCSTSRAGSSVAVLGRERRFANFLVGADFVFTDFLLDLRVLLFLAVVAFVFAFVFVLFFFERIWAVYHFT